MDVQRSWGHLETPLTTTWKSTITPPDRMLARVSDSGPTELFPVSAEILSKSWFPSRNNSNSHFKRCHEKGNDLLHISLQGTESAHQEIAISPGILMYVMLHFWKQWPQYLKPGSFPEYLEHMVSKIRDSPSNKQYISGKKKFPWKQEAKGITFFFFFRFNIQIKFRLGSHLFY